MFVRTLLAVSLSCMFAGSVFAAATAEQPLNPQMIATPASSALAPQPITTLASQSALQQPASTAVASLQQPASTAVAAVQQDVTQANQTLDNLQKTEDQTAAIGETTTPTSPTKASSSNAAAASWTLDGINNAQWYDNIGKGQFPIYARAHVMLNNAHASPGAIDGSSGQNTLKAISAFQQMNGLKPTGVLTKETWDALLARQGNKPAFIEHTLTANDVKGPFAKSIPSDYALQAKMPGLYYTRVSEALAEKFHMDEEFLKKLNPKSSFKAGDKILVTNIRNELPEDIHLIVAVKSARQLYLFNSRNQMVGAFPASIGGTNTPSPSGTHTITGVARNPHYSYSPSNFVQGNNLKPLSLPPGPNGPVGNIWISLSKRSFGIHGTPNPSMISKSFSHGCIRLTNWDANDLGRKVKNGTTVIFKE